MRGRLASGPQEEGHHGISDAYGCGRREVKFTQVQMDAARERYLQRVADPAPMLGPQPQPCVCGAPRHEHGGPARTGACAATECRRYARDAVDELVERVEASAGRDGFRAMARRYEQRERDKRAARYAGRPKTHISVGASDTSSCPRKVMYRERPPEGFRPDPVDKTEATMGTIIHAFTMRERGLAFPWREIESELSIDGLDSHIRPDDYDPITCTVDDVKTAGEWVWDTLGPDGPAEDVWDQVFLYGLALVRSGKPVRTVSLTYVRRSNGADEPFTRPWDEERATAVLNRLIGMAATLDLGGELERKFTSPDHPLCKRCFARTECWQLDRAARLRRNPPALVYLGDDPEVERIAAVAADHVDAKATVKEFEAQAEFTKSLISDQPPGRYGDFEIVAASRKSGGPDHKARVEQIEGWWDVPDGERPPLEALPYPVKQGSTWTEIKPVRKATRDRIAREAARVRAAQEAAAAADGVTDEEEQP